MDLSEPLLQLRGPSIHDRLRHNIIPSDVERIAISRSLAIAQAHLVNLSLSAHSETTTLASYVVEYSSLLSKIRELPDEILQLIFLQSDIHDHLEVGGRVNRPAVQPDTPHIAAVCSHWRSVVVNTPLFWASIRTPLRSGQKTLSLLRLFLERSQNAPLSLKIWTGEYPSINLAIVQTIVQHTGRWKQLCVPPGIIADNLISSTPIPRLESITINPNLPGVGTIRITDAPKLRAISLASVLQVEDIPELPLHQICRVSAHVKWRLCGQLVAMFPNLTHLTISTDEEVVRAPNPEPSLSVRDLTIFGENTTLLNVMNLPNLKQLQIFNCEKWDSSSVEAHTQRSGCRLTTLSLHNVRIRGSELLQLLRALPTLETLQITQPFPNSVIDMVLAALTPRPHLNDLVLPVLTKIVLAGTYLFLTDSLLKLLEARLDSDYPGTSLAVIDITLRDRPIPTPDLERFAALRGSSFASLVCLDENRKWVRICNGRWLR